MATRSLVRRGRQVLLSFQNGRRDLEAAASPAVARGRKSTRVRALGARVPAEQLCATRSESLGIILHVQGLSILYKSID